MKKLNNFSITRCRLARQRWLSDHETETHRGRTRRWMRGTSGQRRRLKVEILGVNED